MCVKPLQLSLTLCDLMDCSPPGSSVHGILQARMLVGCYALLQGNLPNLGIEPASLTSPALAVGFFTTSATWEAQFLVIRRIQKGEEGVMCDLEKGQGAASRAAGGLEGT